MIKLALWTLTVFLFNLYTEVVAVYDVHINFKNDCEGPILVHIIGEKNGSLHLEPEEMRSFQLCDGLCTGFLGSASTHTYTHWAEATNDENLCSPFRQNETIVIGGFSPRGKTQSHTVSCGNCNPNHSNGSVMLRSIDQAGDRKLLQTIAPPVLERFNLKLDWNPSSCLDGETVCVVDSAINAFTIDRLDPVLVYRPADNTRCMDPKSKEAKNLVVTDMLTEETLNVMNCIFADSSGGPNEQLWKDVYITSGSCTGLSVEEYFSLMADKYMQIDPNRILYELGVTNGTSMLQSTVDRNTLMDTVSAEVGKSTWIECNADTKVLEVVLVCLSPYPPYEVIDCPMDRNDKESTNGIPCNGQLKLPAAPGLGYVKESCKKYMPYALSVEGLSPIGLPLAPVEAPVEAPAESPAESPAIENGDTTDSTTSPPEKPFVSSSPSNNPQLPLDITRPASAAPTPAENSSSGVPIGAIIGGAVGGLVLIAIIAAFIYYIVAKKNKEKNEPNDQDPKAQINHPSTAVFDGFGGHQDTKEVSVDIDPNLTWMQTTEKKQVQISICHEKEFLYRDVKILNPIGSGSFGTVYKALYKNKNVALKMFQNKDAAVITPAMDFTQQGTTPTDESDKVLARLEKEVELLGSLEHPNIVTFLGFCRAPPCIMTELCSQGSLAHRLRSSRENSQLPLSWRKRLRYITETAEGLQYLHSKGILHMDLKSPNVLIDDADTAKLSDFNLSKYIDNSMNSASLQGDNPRWLAPEIIRGSAATMSSDVYAFGIVMWEALTLETPWEGETSWIIVDQIQKGQRPSFQHNKNLCSLSAFSAYTSLMESCWSGDPAARPSAEVVTQRLRDMM